MNRRLFLSLIASATAAPIAPIAPKAALPAVPASEIPKLPTPQAIARSSARVRYMAFTNAPVILDGFTVASIETTK